MKSAFSIILLLSACVSTGAVGGSLGEIRAECCDGERYFSGYIKTKNRGYFRGDEGEYFAVSYKDDQFRDQVSAILREHDLKQKAVCIQVEFCGSVGGESGDLVNNVVEIKNGKRLELISCPSI